VEFGVLGPLVVLDDVGDVRAIGSSTQRLILASLLVRPAANVTTHALVDAIWGDAPPRTAFESLRSQVSRLRQVVGARLEGTSDGYRLVLVAGSDRMDAARFESALREARDDPTQAAIDALVEALGTWRGDAFGELADAPTVYPAARHLEAARLDAWELVANAALDHGRAAEAVANAQRILDVDEVRESAWVTLVRALARSGRPVEAMRSARRAAAVLDRSGLEPVGAARAAT